MGLPNPYYQDEAVTIYHADCHDILPLLPKVDLVLTDPPYPDQHPEYELVDIDFLCKVNCRQFIFWSAKEEFLLDYTAIHIWDKQVGCASEYERIFERNGQRNFKIFRCCAINGSLTTRYLGEIFYGHPSQKPIKLIKRLLLMSEATSLILDPFLGSGTTARAAKDLGRRCIGIEIEEKYCEIAAKRMSQMVMELGTE